jgi:hypothetical protein
MSMTEAGSAGDVPGLAPDPATKGYSGMWTRMGAVVLMTAVTLLGPALRTSEATHRGDDSRPDAVFYELTEEAALRADGFREASSSLEGRARPGSALCPDGLQLYAKRFFPKTVGVKTTPRCRVVATGHSVIDLNPGPGFGSGEIDGAFAVVVNSVATNLTDAAELVVMTGTFKGQVQVTDIAGRIIEILPGAVFAPETVLPGFPEPPRGASFTGTFRLPFTVHHVAVYLSDHGALVPVQPDERALGDPTVRLEINFD